MNEDIATLLARSEELYERYGVPLERDHLGKFVAIAEDGRTLLGDSLNDVADRVVEKLGLGSFVFKIGERAVGRIR